MTTVTAGGSLQRRAALGNGCTPSTACSGRHVVAPEYTWQRLIRRPRAEVVSEVLQKSILFLSSYSPVFALLAFQAEWANWWWLRVLLLALCVGGVGGLALILVLTRSKPLRRMRVRSRRDAGAESAAFLAGYLLPLITATVDSAYTAWATVVYLLLAYIITVRSSLIQVNPILLVLGYRILALETAPEQETSQRAGSGYLVTRRDVRIGDIIRVRRFGGDVFVAESGIVPREGDTNSEQPRA